MHSILLALCMVVASCGIPQDVPSFRELVVPPPNSTAADVLAENGPPCTRSNEGAVEVWAYCAMPCRHDVKQWCLDECLPECEGWWRAWVVAGYVTRTEGPPPMKEP